MEPAPAPPPEPPPPRRGRALGAAALVVLAVALVYGRAVGHDFVLWDDNYNVSENAAVLEPTLAGLARHWRAPHYGQYAPLTYTLWMAEGRVAAALGLRGEDAAAVFHAGSLLLHALAALAALRLLRRTGAGLVGATLGALLFALHPLQVEAVAWVSETRGLLAGLFGLLALERWLRFRQAGTWSAYGLATAAFVLALLAKPSAVALPLVALVLDRGCGARRWRGALAALAPWLALGAGLALFTARLQGGALLREPTPLAQRPWIALDALGAYARLFLWPHPLGIVHGRTPASVVAHGLAGTFWVLPPLLAALPLLLPRAWRRAAWTAEGLAVAALLPVLGLAPFAHQHLSTVAERYAYLALLGPAAALAWLAGTRPRLVAAVAGAWLVVLAGASWRQVGAWRDSGTLFEQALALAPGCARVRVNYGLWLERRGEAEAAVAQYRAALAADPREPAAHANLARRLELDGDRAGAREHLEEALRLEPDYALAHLNLAKLLAPSGPAAAALEHFRAYLALEPANAVARSQYALVLAREGRGEEAARELREALRLAEAQGLDELAQSLRARLAGARRRQGR